MRRPSLVLLLSTGSALRPATPAAKISALGNAADKKNTPKDIYVAQKPSGRRETQRLNAAALEEELKTNTPYWYDDRIHSFGNVGFGGVFASVCAPLATWAIDQAAYEGRDVRSEACAAAGALLRPPRGVSAAVRRPKPSRVPLPPASPVG